jgi:biotin carboxylase
MASRWDYLKMKSPERARFECRINAESADVISPLNPGQIMTGFPLGLGIRIETHCYQGYVILHLRLAYSQTDYKSSREKDAVNAMQLALQSFRVEGIQNLYLFSRPHRHPD